MKNYVLKLTKEQKGLIRNQIWLKSILCAPCLILPVVFALGVILFRHDISALSEYDFDGFLMLSTYCILIFILYLVGIITYGSFKDLNNLLKFMKLSRGNNLNKTTATELDKLGPALVQYFKGIGKHHMNTDDSMESIIAGIRQRYFNKLSIQEQALYKSYKSELFTNKKMEEEIQFTEVQSQLIHIATLLTDDLESLNTIEDNESTKYLGL